MMKNLKMYGLCHYIFSLDIKMLGTIRNNKFIFNNYYGTNYLEYKMLRKRLKYAICFI